ncbi:MAG TPA: phage portal protein [Tepidisphaeraceae bacterium]|nr:phage portal protein [Tepidisphaeraceae bacterium]
MGFFTRLFKRDETRSIASDYGSAGFGIFGPSGYNDTGVTITEENAVICSAVWSCVWIIAQTASTFPVHIIRRKNGEKLYEHPLHRVLAISPNAYMTPATFREVLLVNALLYGGSVAVIDRDELGNVEALYPLRSSDVRPIRRGGLLTFEARVGSSSYTFTPDQVVHLLGWSVDGITPLSPVRSASQTIGLDVAMSRYAAKAFSGGNVGGILQTPPMNKDAMKEFVASWRANYTGIDNAFKVAVLPDPMKFVPTTLDPEKGQLIQSRQAQVLEICRLWKVPPSMLGILDKSSYASLEQQNTAFYQQTILPWLIKLEQELLLKCLLVREQSELEIKFNADALLRASTQERYTAYQTGRQGGWLSINDVRRMEGLPPVEGGDTYLTPLNMQPVNGQLPPAPTPTPAPTPAKPDPAATRALLSDVAHRVLTKERNALHRAAKKHAAKPDELRAWAEMFYRSHAGLVARVFTAPIKTAGITTTPEDYASQHCADSLRAIVAIVEAGGTFDDLGDEWDAIRPHEIAQHLIPSNN